MSTLEVGKMEPGTNELKFNGTGSSYHLWEEGKANVAGGIGVRHWIYNASEKSMKYITFVYVPYNPVGDVVACSTSGKIEARGKLTGPLKPYEESVVEWEALWYNTTITEVKLKEVVIQYMDDSEETISGENIACMDDEGSVYFEKVTKPLEAERAAKKAINDRKTELQEAYRGFKVFNCIKKMKDDEEMQFHANQGLWLFIFKVIAVICIIIPLITIVIGGIAIIFSMKCIAAIQDGKRFEIPVLSKIRIVK